MALNLLSNLFYLSGGYGSYSGGSGFLGTLFASAIVSFIIMIALYIYTSLAYMAIAKKVGYPSPAIAWIPLVGPALIASKTAQMHWWPILLLIGIIIPILGLLAMLAFMVFFVIWMWKTFEAVGKPGWWSILQVIPLVNIIYLVLLGIAAWGK